MQYYIPNILIRRSRLRGTFNVVLSVTEPWSMGLGATGTWLEANWGDGSTIEHYTSEDLSTSKGHKYATGTYTASFKGAVTRFTFPQVGQYGNKDPIIGCNFNWDALPGLDDITGLFQYCGNLASTLDGLIPVRNLDSAFMHCAKLRTGSGLRLRSDITRLYHTFNGCILADFDINNFGESFPALVNLGYCFYNSGFWGDASAFVAKCTNPTLGRSEAFAGSRCTNIPA